MEKNNSDLDKDIDVLISERVFGKGKHDDT